MHAGVGKSGDGPENDRFLDTGSQPRPSSKLNNQTLREWPVLGQVALGSGGAAEVRSLEQGLEHLMQSGAVDMTAETFVQAIAKMDVFVRAPVRIEAFGRGDAARVHHR